MSDSEDEHGGLLARGGEAGLRYSFALESPAPATLPRPSPSPPPLLFGHPRGLYVLLCTEVWERFSFYGNRALLTLYLADSVFARPTWRSVWGASTLAAIYGAPDDDSGASPAARRAQCVRLATHIYGLYTAMVYLTPLGGGLLADRVWGQKRVALGGAALMALGHAAMTSETLTFVGLALIALGCGGFKPNVSTQVGRLYGADHAHTAGGGGGAGGGASAPGRRDAAYLLFYCGINVGAAAAPLVCGGLAATRGGPALGFAAAGAGMLAALATLLAGWAHLPLDPPGAAALAPAAAPAGGAVAAAAPPPPPPPPLGRLLRRHRARLCAVASLAALNVGFWASYEQTGGALAVFMQDGVARGGVPAAFFQSLNPVFVLALTPPLAALWRARARAGRDPHPVAKTALGGALLAASWLLLALACAGSGGTGGAGGPGPGSAGAPAAPPQKTPASAVVLQQLVLTAAELLVSPVGLQFVAAEAPPELGSLVMGAWFLSSFLGSYAGGALGARYPDVPPATFWTLCAAVAAAAAAATAAARGALLDALAQPADDD